LREIGAAVIRRVLQSCSAAVLQLKNKVEVEGEGKVKAKVKVEEERGVRSKK
jgi:hypothetical protein